MNSEQLSDLVVEALEDIKAKDIVKVAVARARWLYPQDEEQIPVTDAALVIGGGVAGIQAALDLADVLGTSPKLWMNLQATYDLDKAEKTGYESLDLVPKRFGFGLPIRVGGHQ